MEDAAASSQFSMQRVVPFSITLPVQMRDAARESRSAVQLVVAMLFASQVPCLSDFFLDGAVRVEVWPSCLVVGEGCYC